MKILVALSGGLDSAATVLLLNKAGFDADNIEALFIDMHGSEEAIENAFKVAEQLRIKLNVVRCKEQFEETVRKHFFELVESGKTPSTCAFCNPNFKFKILLEQADKLGFEKIATGHYVQIEEVNGKVYLKRAVDSTKDQSYFLWGLSQEQISRTIFPLGELKKSDVKLFLNQHGFQAIASIKESMSLCFIPKGVDYKEFISMESDLHTGDIVDKNGAIIGSHSGFQFYTIGQKRGFDVGERLVEIYKIDALNNLLFATDNPEDLYTNSFQVTNIKITDKKEFFTSNKLSVVVRGLGRNPEGYCQVVQTGDIINVTTQNRVWAVASGQSAVFYIEDRLVAGGEILR